MTSRRLEKHIEAARREVRVHAWRAPQLESAWRALGERYARRTAAQRRAKIVGAGALALAAVFVLAFGLLNSVEPPEAPAASAPQRRAAEPSIVSFEDGSDVRFEKGVELEVQERTAERVVVRLEAGAAHFRVRHNPHRVFRVEAGSVLVEDLGTDFVVEKDVGSVSVSVSEGSVAITYPEGNSVRRATLAAGESGSYALPSPTHEGGVTRGASNHPEGAPHAPTSDSPTGAPTRSPDAHSTPDWRALARAGEHQQAYDLIASRGFSDVRDEASDLMLASDVARLSRHAAEAATLLRKLLAHHEGDPRAPSAAFTLGRVLMGELGRPREAAQAFAKAEALAPRGNLAQDALARTVEAWHRAGDLTRAEAELTRYRTRYPEGRHRAMLERLIGTP